MKRWPSFGRMPVVKNEPPRKRGFFIAEPDFSKVIPKRWQNLTVFGNSCQFLPVFDNFQARENFQKIHTTESLKHRKKGTQTMKNHTRKYIPTRGAAQGPDKAEVPSSNLGVPISFRIVIYGTKRFFLLCHLMTVARNVRRSNPAKALSYLKSYQFLTIQEA